MKVMKKVVVKQAEKHEVDWVNSKYDEIGFVKSNIENEFIVIANVENKGAGLGRLVRIDHQNIELGGIYVFPEFRGLGVAENIVKNLCKSTPFEASTIWCLPFKNLLNFYSKFGFQKHETGTVPEEIIKKLEWCNSGNRYKKEVFLLYKKG
jgi:N-acetylglutamate synthase-like GNAT family acetyltransferase